ncbi:DUF5988 family protein [Actinocrispum wychmicini]|uniref:DUF5988 family protein n=1 Tax=Actinocrispum wychmicini TaxID=1213861 RepID=UPI001FB66EDA|nr:DUF5988 family protein [Actinocrispum wychmicini]
MTTSSEASTGRAATLSRASTATIVLEGGPRGLAGVCRVSAVAMPARVTVDHYGRHEHFERTDGVETVDGQQVPVFRWSYSTAIAE